ncbi:hypothetical protein [Myxococcus eversor]|uniref:hypothetical protein n=1 Tax=Myxococcus eversor TaxID=2709661 RepID=UPI0013D7949E|nr:hypothetical protein [Myxococcus eversor]
MPCVRCGKKNQITVKAACVTEECELFGEEIELHKMHLMKPTDKDGDCTKCGKRLVSPEAREKEVISLLTFSKPDTLFGLFKERYVSRIACCHGCLGANEMGLDEENRLQRLGTKNRLCLTALTSVLESGFHEPGPVGETIDGPMDRMRAHCVISNHALEWYFPSIVISFCKLANPRRYGITEPGTYFFRAAMDVVERIWEAAAGKSGRALYDAVTSGLAKDLEDNQDFPAKLNAILAAMRSSLADKVTPSHRNEDDPKVLGTLPPEHGGGKSLATTTMDDKIESFNDSGGMENLFTALGQYRSPVFMAGNQCKPCEDSQGEDGLIQRHLDLDLAGASMKHLITAYHGQGGAFALTVDYLRPCLDQMGKKLVAANKDAAGFRNKRLNRWLNIVLSKENWPVFSLYATTCLIEASLGVSPFRPSGAMRVKVDANPCPIVHR